MHFMAHKIFQSYSILSHNVSSLDSRDMRLLEWEWKKKKRRKISQLLSGISFNLLLSDLQISNTVRYGWPPFYCHSPLLNKVLESPKNQSDCRHLISHYPIRRRTSSMLKLVIKWSWWGSGTLYRPYFP